MDEVRLRFIGNDVFLLEDCSSPLSKEQLCLEIAASGIDTLLLIAEDNTPWSFRLPSGLWCYCRPLADPESPSPALLQRIADFVEYETGRGRRIAVWIGYDRAEPKLLDTIRDAGTFVGTRFPSDDPCCCRPYHAGCHGQLVCHGTTLESARAILRSGRILSKKSLDHAQTPDLSSYALKENVGDPDDYYDYVSLANGDCVAPDMVAAARKRSSFVSPREADTDFYPAVRFYFDPAELSRHPHADWDGICALKMRDEIRLDATRFAVVAPKKCQDGGPLVLEASSGIPVLLAQIDHTRHFGLSAWSSAALQAANRLLSRNAS